MITQRHLKQGVYAGGCLTLVMIIVISLFVVVVDLPEQRSPTPTPEPLFESIIVEHVDVIHHAGRIDAVARVRNPNPRAGVAEYPATFVILDEADQEIARRTETTYILPGSVQYIVALSIEVSDRVHHARLDVPSLPDFITVPSNVRLPSFNTFLVQRTRRGSGALELEEQKGIVSNTSTFNFQRVEVRAVALNAAGETVGVGMTFLGELKVNEQREFTVQWPVGEGSTQRVIVVPSTNIFQEENILRELGDRTIVR